MLFLLVRAVLKARGLVVLSAYRAPGGSARSGVYGTECITVKVDQVSPTDRVVPDSRPNLVVRDQGRRELVILEVACAWEPLIMECGREKRCKYQELAADLARQYPGYRITVVPVVLGELGDGLPRRCSVPVLVLPQCGTPLPQPEGSTWNHKLIPAV